MKKKILIIFGTRPEAIKMAPLIKEFKLFPKIFETKVCVTAQHRDMLDQVLEFFEIVPDFDLNLMKPNQNLFNLSSLIILGLQKIYKKFNPDYIFVHGDTTTSSMSALSAFYAKIKVCHIEAGLRTNNKYSPYPEEINRQITARIADFHFAPTKNSKINLINENIKSDTIIVTGNTVIDALFITLNKLNINQSKNIKEISAIIQSKDVILVTGHRRENHGKNFINICNALKSIATINPEIIIVYPVHLNPNVQGPVNKILSDISNVILIDPLPYYEFIWLMNRSKLVITDSGGIQEEAPSLGKPVIVMRNNTERPEALEAGTVILTGTDEDKIIYEVNELLNDKNKYDSMSKLHNPYGDGKSCQRIVKSIIQIEEIRK